jgi:penicillin amidase
MLAFYEARDYLANLFGNDIKEWKWGKIHRMDFKNIPFSETPLKPIWHRSYEAGGNTRTINVASHYLEQHNFDGIHGPNLRLIVDMNNQSFILTSIDTGLSDRVLSSHFQDQMELHRKGEFIPVPIGDGKKQYTSKFVLE